MYISKKKNCKIVSEKSLQLFSSLTFKHKTLVLKVVLIKLIVNCNNFSNY